MRSALPFPFAKLVPLGHRKTTLIATLALIVLLTASGVGGAQQDDGRLALTTSSEAAAEHFWMGVTDGQNISAVRATRHFDAAIEADPAFSLAHAFKAFTEPGFSGAQRSARIGEAMASMNAASAEEILLATALRELTGGRANVASRLFYTLTELVPGDPHIAFYATQFAGARGDTTDVITRWQNLVGEFPDLAAAYNLVAYQQWNRGNKAGAMTSVRKYLELLPEHPNAHDSYAELLQFDGNFPAALRHYQHAAEVDPTYTQAYLGMAEVYQMVGAGEGAREQIALAIEHAPSAQNRINAMRAMANSYLMDGNGEEALAQLAAAARAAEEADQNNAARNAHLQSAMTAAFLGQSQSMEAHLARAAEFGRPDAPIHLGASALAYAMAGDSERSGQLADELIESSGAAVWRDMGHSVRAMNYLAADQNTEALAELEAANPGNAMVQALLADCYAKMELPVAAAGKRNEFSSNRQMNLTNAFMAFPYLRLGDM